jgi:hypothetical protein
MRWQPGLISAFSACVVVVGLATSGAAAQDIDALICETDRSFDCAPGSNCIEDDAEAIGLPSILHVNLKSDQVVGTMPDGTDLKADFAGEVQKDGRLVVTGIQAGLGWTMTVAKDTGTMTLAISGDSIGFVVFGSCVPD